MQSIRPGLLIAATIILATSICQAEDADRETGYVHVEQIDGVWWFISPDGEKFVSIGVNHIEPHLWLAPYNAAATLEKYGGDMVGPDGHFNTKG